jgi:hypothetical protein
VAGRNTPQILERYPPEDRPDLKMPDNLALVRYELMLLAYDRNCACAVLFSRGFQSVYGVQGEHLLSIQAHRWCRVHLWSSARLLESHSTVAA